MRKIQIYSTPTVEGCPIEENYGFIVANQVAGTGFLSDFTASFSDFFGGNSGTYRNQMNKLHSEVMDAISQKAMALGANAIVCARIDFDNISAKNMSMFMVSIQGTAVKLKEVKQTSTSEKGLVTIDTLQCAINNKIYKDKLTSGNKLSESQWKYVLSHDMPELAEPLLESYIASDNVDPEGKLCIDNFPIYLSRLPRETAIDLIYNAKEIYKNLISKLHLFDARKVFALIQDQDNAHIGIDLLEYDQDTYSQEDLSNMKAIVNYFDNLPDLGKMEEVKGGIFSSSGIKYICQCGCKNDKDEVYCNKCGKNIKGISYYQQKSIDSFKLKVNALEEIFAKMQS